VVENFRVLEAGVGISGWLFQFESAPDLGQDGFCSTWNIFHFGLVPKMFHVEQRATPHLRRRPMNPSSYCCILHGSRAAGAAIQSLSESTGLAGGLKPPRNPQVFNGTDPKAERTSCAAVWGSMQQPAHSCAGRKHVDIQNAFINKTLQPTAEEVSAALGATAGVWKQLVDWLAVEKGVADQEWKSGSLKYGWSLRLKLKKRTIVYLAPCDGCFRVAFVLGDRAVAAARESDLSKGVLKLLDEAPRYAEGTGVRLMVKGAKDLAAVRKLAVIKLAN
jgi:hypothetical protein